MRRYPLLCAVLAMLLQTTASAQTRDAREQASAHFQRGVELFEDGAYRAALAEFRRAYSVSPNYRLLFNIGQTQLELQDYLGAAKSYEDYLLQGGSQVPQAQRESLENALPSLHARVGRIALTVNRDGAEVFLDDNLLGRTPITSAIPVNVGQHRLVIRGEDGATATKIVELTSGEIVELSIELAAPTPGATSPAVEPRGRPLSTKLAIAGFSTGGALLLGSLVTGVLALSADKEFDDILKSADVDPKKESDQRSKLKTLVLTTDVLFATGAVVAVAGTVMWFLGRREDRKLEEEPPKSARLRVDVGMASLSLRGQF